MASPRGRARPWILALAVGGALASAGCIADPRPVMDDPQADPWLDAAGPPADAAPDRAVDFGPDAGLDCPEARIAPGPLGARPLEVIELKPIIGIVRGDEAPVVRWRYTVVSRPPGSTAQVVERHTFPDAPAAGGDPDDPTTPSALFFLDLAGRYVFELTVEDAAGRRAPAPGCPSDAARRAVEVVPESPVHVELVWHTPDDPDETDADGTDLDLHVTRPGGDWLSQGDCYYGNPNPDWDPPGPAGDPNLDIDDVDGAGPENIRIARPQPTAAQGGPYRVAVHSYRLQFGSEGAEPPAEATLRLYLNGLPAFEGRHTFRTEDAWWRAARIFIEPAGPRAEAGW